MTYASFDIEKTLWQKGYNFVCGVDEVGRGCFAGPVVAGAVVFPRDVVLPRQVADSKLLKPKDREELAGMIKELASCFSVAEIDVPTINDVGIANATQLAFKKCIDMLSHLELVSGPVSPDFIMIDAFYIDQVDKAMQMPVKGGDRLSSSIAAASIIAKVYRDNLMGKLHETYPNYGFDKHKGYGTKSHREAIYKYGLSPLHRTSFDLKKFLPQKTS